jgi:short-chain fatty acids transporter
MGILARAALALTRWTERWIPDSWVIAVVLTLVVAGFAMTVGGASPAVALNAWGNGLWALLSLAMQFTLMMVAAYACAMSKPVKRAFLWLASRPNPDRPRQAIVLMATFSTLACWFNWAFSLVVTAAFLPFVVKANPKSDFRLLVSCAYLGMGTVWHCGLSGSAPLIIATPNNFLIQGKILADTIPIARTILSPFNLMYSVMAGVLGIAVAAALVPMRAKPASLDFAPETGDTVEASSSRTPAERMDRWPGWSLIASGAILAYLVSQFRNLGMGRAWTIDSFNLLFLALALLLHWRPKAFLQACEAGIRNTWGIVIQYPLYAGIFGLMAYTDLGKTVTHLFIQATSPRSFPVVVYLYSTTLSYFIPSGGSKWIVEAPYLIPAAKALGISIPSVTMSYAYGDMTTHLIQPFWAIPILTAAKLRFGDIMGYCFIIGAAMLLFNLIVLWFLPLQM